MVSTAVSDALSIAKSRTEKLTEIGGFQFNVESCKQLQIWAKEIILDVETMSFRYRLHRRLGKVELGYLVSVLADKSNWKERLIDGKLTRVWFPDKTRWVNKRLDLSHTPGLTELECSENDFTELDLSHTPGLTKLQCWDNPLTELDLSHTPGLRILWCAGNQLEELDIRNNPTLKICEVGDGVKIIKHDWRLRDE